jgi:hypothetical protein
MPPLGAPIADARPPNARYNEPPEMDTTTRCSRCWLKCRVASSESPRSIRRVTHRNIRIIRIIRIIRGQAGALHTGYQGRTRAPGPCVSTCTSVRHVLDCLTGGVVCALIRDAYKLNVAGSSPVTCSHAGVAQWKCVRTNRLANLRRRLIPPGIIHALRVSPCPAPSQRLRTNEA